MKKIIMGLFICMGIFSVLKAENIEFEGCDDTNHNITSEKSDFVKSMITNNIKSKAEFLKSLGFEIKSSIDYKEVCKRLIISIKDDREKEHSYSYINNIIENYIFKNNNINYDEYSSKLNIKIPEKK
ncbi:hypothetical protein PT447_10855 [Aliarcobacter butzleri]|uniref:hypothetical protein n=1 Tax=Aliarcobacter butzleri TaxID=28197 RepID=UPI0024DED1D7|nr:hypothetical protein [Aliarcobacter butzleri]MDK2065425.1 hypothetical protein [Aliarcobacter butzleri]